MPASKIKMDTLRLEVGSRLAEIEETIHAWGLTKITRLTLIARDPEDDEMIVIWTNEPEGNTKAALAAAAKQDL